MMPTEGVSVRQIGAVTAAIMRDIGWPLTISYHQVDITGQKSAPVGVPITLTATYYSPASASAPTSYTWSATDQADFVHNPGTKTDSRSLTWTSPGKKRVIVTANGSTGQVAGVFEVIVQASATTPTASPTVTPAARALLPEVTRN